MVYYRGSVFFPLSQIAFQCCSYVVENCKIHVDLRHRFSGCVSVGGGGGGYGFTELTKFCKLILDRQNFQEL